MVYALAALSGLSEATFFLSAGTSQSAAKVAFQTTTTKRVPWAQGEEIRLRVETAKDLNFTH